MLKPAETARPMHRQNRHDRREHRSDRQKTTSDEEVFDHIFQEHWEKIWQVCCRLTGDPDEAEDIALEAFVRLYQSPPRAIVNPGGWLYRTASRLGLNNLRARRRRQYYERWPDELFKGESAIGDPVKTYEQNQEALEIRLTIRKMKERSAQLLILKSMGFSYKEIGEALNLKPGSIGTLLVRAQKEFEKIWQREAR